MGRWKLVSEKNKTAYHQSKNLRRTPKKREHRKQLPS